MIEQPKLFGQQQPKLPFAQYVAAALVETARQRGKIGIACRVEELPQQLFNAFSVKIEAEEIADAVEILVECDAAHVANDPLAGTFVAISGERFDKFIQVVNADKTRYYKALEDAGDDPNDYFRAEDNARTYTWDIARKYKVLESYSEFGKPFIEAAIGKVGASDLGTRLAQAGDRIVSFSDNMPVVEQIRSHLDEIDAQLSKNNELGDTLGDAREEAIAEVKTLKSVMTGKQSRADYLLAMSKRVLGWLGRLVAKTSLEDIVKHLTKLFLDWLS